MGNCSNPALLAERLENSVDWSKQDRPSLTGADYDRLRMVVQDTVEFLRKPASTFDQDATSLSAKTFAKTLDDAARAISQANRAHVCFKCEFACNEVTEVVYDSGTALICNECLPNLRWERTPWLERFFGRKPAFRRSLKEEFFGGLGSDGDWFRTFQYSDART